MEVAVPQSIPGLLAALRLQLYELTFSEYGVDDVAYLRGLGEDSCRDLLAEMGVSPGTHMKELMAAVFTEEGSHTVKSKRATMPNEDAGSGPLLPDSTVATAACVAAAPPSSSDQPPVQHTTTACGSYVLHTATLPPLDDGSSGHSVTTIPDFATQDECRSLIDSASLLLSSGQAETLKTSIAFINLNNGLAVGGALPPRLRLPIATPLNSALLLRLLALLEEDELSGLAMALFGQRANLDSMSRTFSDGEPAVNIYGPGGEFAPHTDKEALSLLIPLSPSAAFRGGGTAFWSDSHFAWGGGSGIDGGQQKQHGHQASAVEGQQNNQQHMQHASQMSDRSTWRPHCHVVAAAPGTAVVFRGNITHAGLPVSWGTRHLFVMSFSLRPKRKAGHRLCVAPVGTGEPVASHQKRKVRHPNY
jgi:hypothetical protein